MTEPVVEFDPSSYAIHEDPFPLYRRMQDEAPLYHNAEVGFWALTRFEDVLAGLADGGPQLGQGNPDRAGAKW